MMSDLASGSLSSLIYLDLGRQRGVWLLTNTRQIAHSTTTLYMVKWPYICGWRPGVFSQKKIARETCCIELHPNCDEWVSSVSCELPWVLGELHILCSVAVTCVNCLRCVSCMIVIRMVTIGMIWHSWWWSKPWWWSKWPASSKAWWWSRWLGDPG